MKIRLLLAVLTSILLHAQNQSRWSLPEGGTLATGYRSPTVEAARLQNSPRWQQLLRDGRIRLSLQDAIALALENNLDLELERYAPRIAETDFLRARAGSLLRGIPLAVREGPQGLGGPSVSANGTLAGGDTPSLNALVGPGVQTDLSILGSLPLSTGPALPNLDPTILGNIRWDHQSLPQNSVFLPNIRSLNANTTTADVGFQQGFLTGGTLDLTWRNLRQETNSPLLNYNPFTASSIGVSFTQPLLRGFGWSVNNRYIRIAKNNRQVASYVMHQQIIATVSAVVRLYWDLVSLNDDVGVRRDAVSSAEQLVKDNEAQVEAGTAAPIDLTRARAELTRRRRDMAVAQSLVRQQEMVLKDYLTAGKLDGALATAEVIATDSIFIPPQESPVQVEEMVARALKIRPDIAQARLQLESSEISLKGSRSALRPSLDLVASMQNNGLAGQASTIANTFGGARVVDPSFLGGYRDALGQVFQRNFPDYGVGVQLAIPLGNRAARADVVRDELSLRQQHIRLQQIEKQVRLEITNALLAVEQARSSYEATRDERILQEETLAAEREKVEVGASTTFFVIQFQRDLAAARSAEVSAQSSYLKAKTALQRAVGSLLDDYGVIMAEAEQGVVSKTPTLPASRP